MRCCTSNSTYGHDFIVKESIIKKEIEIGCCPTTKTLADHITTPLQVRWFEKWTWVIMWWGHFSLPDVRDDTPRSRSQEYVGEISERERALWKDNINITVTDFVRKFLKNKDYEETWIWPNLCFDLTRSCFSYLLFFQFRCIGVILGIHIFFSTWLFF